MNREYVYTLFERLYIILFLCILALVPFHALFSTWFGHLFGWSLVWKSWKELVLLIMIGLSAVILTKRADIRRRIFGSRLTWLIMAFAIVHIVGLAIFRPQLAPLLAGLAIDLRFFAMFMAAQLAVLLAPRVRDRALTVSLFAGAVVVGFGLLQIFILPDDFLAVFGYSKETIAPFLTVDQNPLFVRINSTLRGPNPLGLYVVILASFGAAWLCMARQKLLAKNKVMILAGTFSLLTVLFCTYSRSAWGALAAALLVVGATRFKSAFNWRIMLASLSVLLLLGGVYYAARDTDVVRNLVEHKNPDDPGGNDSNIGHFNSLQQGFWRMLQEPLGRGPGSTGSASLYGSTPEIIENQYLFVAQEAGWVGLALFVAICVVVGWRLYKRDSWIELGLLASLVGISAAGLLLPVWTDDTVALAWWGLAGIWASNQKADTEQVSR